MTKTKNNPTISVIISTYNRAHLIGRAIQSVLNQSYRDFEIIVVDDGSTDNTGEVIKKIQEQDKRIRYIRHRDNRGCASARNTGLDYIDESVDYVCFLDSDDCFMPEKLSTEVQLLETNLQAGFVYSDYILQDEIIGKQSVRKVAAAGRPENFAREHFLTNEAKSGAILYRASVLLNKRFREDLRYNEDSEFLQRIAIEEKGIYSNYPGCWVNFHAGSKSRNTLEIYRAVYSSTIDICKDYPEFIKTMDKDITNYLARLRHNLFVKLMLNAKWDEAVLYAQSIFQRIMAKFHIPFYYYFMKIGIWIIHIIQNLPEGQYNYVKNIYHKVR